MSTSNSKALVDNWMLEAAANVFDYGLDPTPFDMQIREQVNPDEWRKEFINRIQAFLDFLEVFVLHDDVYYEKGWAAAWNTQEKINEISEHFKQVSFSDHKLEKLIADLPRDTTNITYLPIVRDGARKYLALSRVIGISYWPAPERSRYLESNLFRSVNGSFLYVLKEQVESVVKELMEQFSTITWQHKDFVVPNFGSILLANCHSKNDVLTVASEVRNSKETTAFRNWIWSVQTSLEDGDIRKVREAISIVEDVVNDVKRELQGKEKEKSTIKLQIGLSPSIAVESSSIGGLLTKLVRRRFSSSFLRKHIDTSLRNANIKTHIRRLFPEVKDSIPDF